MARASDRRGTPIRRGFRVRVFDSWNPACYGQAGAIIKILGSPVYGVHIRMDNGDIESALWEHIEITED